MSQKTKLLFITSNPPMDEMGGSILLYRQFLHQEEIDLFVMTDRLDCEFSIFPGIHIRLPWILERLTRTRFSLLIHGLIHVSRNWFIPRKLLQAARKYNPDIVLIGADTPLGDLGLNIARKLNVPLGGFFFDWSTFALLGHEWAKRREGRRFIMRYQECDLAFGTCPEMLEHLGPHRNAHTLYPARSRPEKIPVPKIRRAGDPNVLLFAGNLGQWYGDMVARVAEASLSHQDVILKIAGKNATWSTSRKASLRESGIYVGFKKGEEYEQLFRDADCLLICMGFDPEARLIESTSFKSKVVDYLVSGRPIVVWGPKYCTAVGHAEKYGFAETVTDDDPEAVLIKVQDLMNDPSRCSELLLRSELFFNQHLDADVVYRDANNRIIQSATAPKNLILQ